MSRFVLDCAVSRPVDEQIIRWWDAAATRGWPSPTAGYHEARTASALLQQSAATLASLVGAQGAWFAADLGSAVETATSYLGSAAACLATTETDSLRVREAIVRAAALAGVPHAVLGVDDRGRVRDDALAALPAAAVLVTSVGNQEIGTLQADLSAWAQNTGAALILDATTAFGWVDLPVGWRGLVLDARAWGAPSGAVAVCTSDSVREHPFDNIPAAVVAALSAERWAALAPHVRDDVRGRARRLADRVRTEIPGVDVRGAAEDELPHIVSISVLYVDAEALQSRLDRLGYAVGSGSACASLSGEPSHVLAAVGGLTAGNLRIGLTPDIDDRVVDGFVDALRTEVARMRAQMGTDDL